MLLLISSGIPLDLRHILDGFLVFAEGEKHFLDLGLVVVDMRIYGYVFYDVSFALERILGDSFGRRNVGGHLGLIGTSHRCYIFYQASQLAKNTRIRIH